MDYETIEIKLEHDGATTRLLRASVAEWVLSIVCSLPDDQKLLVYADIERRMEGAQQGAAA